MNKTKTEYADYTWNPITGCTGIYNRKTKQYEHCPYCYCPAMCNRFAGDIRANLARTDEYTVIKSGSHGETLYMLEKPMLNDQGKEILYPFGFAPTLHRYRYDRLAKIKGGANISVCSMGDMFDNAVPDYIFEEIFNVCKQYPQHNFLFQTKNPEIYGYLVNWHELPENKNFWYGTTVTRSDDPVFAVSGFNTFVSFEPLMDDVMADFNGIPDNIDWVIIGPETGKKPKTEIKKEWVDNIHSFADENGIPVFHRRGMSEYVSELRHEVPEPLNNHPVTPRKGTTAKCCMCGKEDMKKALLKIQKRNAYICEECFKKLGE